MFEQVVDYTTTGPNRLNFTRYYNSFGIKASTFAAALGRNWRSNYDRYLRTKVLSPGQSSSPTTVIAERGDGRMVTFTLTNGVWVTDTDVDLTLSQSGSTWTLVAGNDTVETYADLGTGEARLSSTVTRDGYTQTLSYNASNQLSSITDSYGRALKFTYAGGLLQTVTTPDGLMLSYGYSPAPVLAESLHIVGGGKAVSIQRLVSVTYSTSPATSQSYLYEDTAQPFALTGIIDEDGNRFATWAYDDSTGQAISSQHAGGADLTIVVYNADGSATVTNALGEQDLYKFATLQGVPKVTEIDRLATATTAAATRTFTYDANGYLASQTDGNGNLTSYVNNTRGLPTKITEAVGTTAARTTAIAWHPRFHLPTKIVTQGLTTSFAYDSLGDPLTRTETDTTDGITRSWSYTWADDLLASVKGPLGDVTAFTPSGHGWVTAITNALGQVTQISGHLPGGLPTVIVDPNGVTTKLTYDTRQRLLSSTVVTAAGNRKTSFAYDPAGSLLRVTLPDGSFLANSYDKAHRLTGTADALGEPIAYALDGLGDPTQTTISTTGGAVVWQNLAMFDALGRLIQDQRGAGQTTSFGYDANGNVLTMLDPLSRTTKYAIDALNRVTGIADPAGGVTKLNYDQHNRPTRVVAANGAVTTYTYDGFGRVTKRVSPDTGTAFFYYDLADNLTQMTDGAGVITRHTYDLLNRVASTSYPGDASENVIYFYDQGGFGIGRLTSVADAVGTLNLTYDERGNELSETRNTGALTLTTAYGYNAASRVASISYPSGTVANYGRNAAGRVTAIRVKTPGGTTKTVVAGVTYKPFGPVSGLTYGNGIIEARAYDGDYRLTGLTTGTVLARGYGYDAADNVMSIADSIAPANSQAFKHDLLDHLTSATGGYGSLAWKYDLVGNRKSESTGGDGSAIYSYLPNSNRLAGITVSGETETFGYSGAGNIATITPASGPAITLGYNQAGRLASVTNGGAGVAGYAYDAFGRRFSKTLPTKAALFQYDQAGRLLEEQDSPSNATTDTVYLNGVPVASIAGSGAVSYLHPDRLGAPQLATNAAKALVWGAAYEPFGSLNGLPSGSLTQNLRFPGQYADTETGWYQNDFRDYAPLWGRYLESDPIGLTGELNTYGYANANPLTQVDPKGLIGEGFGFMATMGHSFSMVSSSGLTCLANNWTGIDFSKNIINISDDLQTQAINAALGFGAALGEGNPTASVILPSALSGTVAGAPIVIDQARTVMGQVNDANRQFNNMYGTSIQDQGEIFDQHFSHSQPLGQ